MSRPATYPGLTFIEEEGGRRSPEQYTGAIFRLPSTSLYMEIVVRNTPYILLSHAPDKLPSLRYSAYLTVSVP